jgi:hypothetical protein
MLRLHGHLFLFNSIFLTNKICMNHARFKDCIEACLKCVHMCYRCASADLQEEQHHMARCVQLNLECAAVCNATAQLMSLGSEQSVAIAKLCAEICRKCEGECRKHIMQHCQECANACHHCAVLCTAL